MEMRAELVINAPAEDAWVVVGERFGEIGEWASAITQSVMDGPPAVGRVRTCQVARFGPIAAGVIKERLTEFDPQARSLSYGAVAGMPWFIAGAVSHWSVHAGPGSACTVRVHATLALRLAARPLGPALRWRMHADTRRALAELRHRVETGHPAPATLTPPAAGPGWSQMWSHSPGFAGVRQDPSVSASPGHERWRTRVNAGQHCWKAYWRQPLANSNLASSATLTCGNAGRGGRQAGATERRLSHFWLSPGSI
jgi:polyketide cyclase/dehydrase/lipid transport protein